MKFRNQLSNSKNPCGFRILQAQILTAPVYSCPPLVHDHVSQPISPFLFSNHFKNSSNPHGFRTWTSQLLFIPVLRNFSTCAACSNHHFVQPLLRKFQIAQLQRGADSALVLNKAVMRSWIILFPFWCWNAFRQSLEWVLHLRSFLKEAWNDERGRFGCNKPGWFASLL